MRPQAFFMRGLNEELAAGKKRKVDLQGFVKPEPNHMQGLCKQKVYGM